MIFITPKVKICIKGLGNEVYFQNVLLFIYITETDDTRRKRVSSLKT